MTVLAYLAVISLLTLGAFVIKIFCVISHTHWDREWYMPLDKFRLKLVDLFDHLLEIIAQYPEYVFHMDAQTVVLEDYLEIRPGNREILEKYVAAGNIVVGPWYLQNDFYLTSGEATVRNLLEGRKLANEFGKCGTVGYAPDQFGNISQLPQILQNFGLDNFVFGRGSSLYEKNEKGQYYRTTAPSEFIWKGADGTKVLAVCMRYWYNNAQRFSADIDKAVELAELVEKSFEGIAATPYLLLMNGVDHLEPQADLLPILEAVNGRLGAGKQIRQYEMGAYIRDVQAYLRESGAGLTERSGELRDGQDFELLKGTLSSRHYLKVENVKMQNLLEHRLEPLYSMLELWGCKGIYSLDHFRWLWKKLMLNHPHDSICGCSCDEVHKHMEDNFGRLNEFAGELLERGLQEALYHAEGVMPQGENYVVLAANTVGSIQDGAMEVELRAPAADGLDAFEIFDFAGSKVPFAVRAKATKDVDVFSPVNLPGGVLSDCYSLYLDAGTLEPFSVRVFTVKKSAQPLPMLEAKTDDIPVIQNEYIRLSVSEDGRVSLTDLKTGRTAEDCLYFEDTADRGDSYVYFPAGDEPILSGAYKPEITVLEKNVFKGRIKLMWKLPLPAYYDFENRRRSEETEASALSLTLTVIKGRPAAEIGYEIDNRSKDHRVRLVVKTDVEDGSCFADIPYDIVRRTENQHFAGTMSRVFPNTSFALLQGGGKGFAVLTEGAHEFEQTDEQTLAFTVLRATGVINRDPESLKAGGGEIWRCPANQCLRKLGGRLGLLPFGGDYETAEIPKAVLAFRNPLLALAAPEDRRKFSGGRPAVQATELQEYFYLSDAYPQGRVPDRRPVLSVKGESVTVSAFKKAEDGKGLILRLFNYSEEPKKAEVAIRGHISKTDMAEEKHTPLGVEVTALTLGSKQIVTLRVE